MKSLILIFVFFFGHAIAIAQDAPYGIAMRGDAKYQASDTHFEYANPDAPKGGTLRLSTAQPFDTLNPFSIGGSPAPSMHYVYGRLTARAWDEPFSLYPLIASKIDVADDRSSLTIQIDKRARFSDGKPITADDVLFSFETLKNHGRPNMRAVYAMATPKRIDDMTIRFDFHDDFTRESVMILAMMPVLQKTWWSGRDFSAPLDDIPPSSGAYTIKSIDAGRSITYARIKNWWAQDLPPVRGHYNFDEIRFDVVRDTSTAIALVSKGKVGFRSEGNIKLWQTSDYGDAQKVTFTHQRAQPAKGIILNTRRAPLDDISVRKALAMLFDSKWVGESIYRGIYMRTRSIFPNTDLAFDAKAQDMSLRASIHAAGALLDSAGWRIKDGVRTKADRTLEFSILVKTKSDEAIALSYARSLKRSGILANIRRVDGATFTRLINNYDYDAVVHEWRSSLSPGTEQAVYWSCDAADTLGSFNYARVCSDKIDDIIAQIPQTSTRDELIEKTKALDELLADEYIWIPLFYSNSDRFAIQPWIKRPDVTPLYGAVVETWWKED